MKVWTPRRTPARPLSLQASQIGSDGMTHPHLRSFMVTVMASLALSSCRSAAPTSRATAPTPAQQPASAEPVVALPALVTSPANIAKARADSARLPYTQADIDFMAGMIAHHSQAIHIAKWAPTHGASASLLTLCARIINAQADEINLMSLWLLDRNQKVPEPSPFGMKHVMGGEEMTMLMPGMLSEAQLKELDAARGPEFDRLFLQDMIQHHRGAIEMVRSLFATPGAGQDEMVFKFASDVNVDQTTEIARMERMLIALRLQGGSK
jgi:uncharacterized protein (DUF305 family)